MATRVITGLIHHASGAVWVGATVTFEMEAGTFTISPDVTFLRDGVTAVTDTTGAFSVTLTSGLNVYWRCSLPDGDGFRFALADGSATTIEALRSASEGLPVPVYSGVDILITDAEEDDVLLHNGTQFINVNAGALLDTDLAADLDSLYIPLGAINAKGDLLVGGANDFVNNLPIGADGLVLTVDSAEVSGVKWGVSTPTPQVDWTPAELTLKAWYKADQITGFADGANLTQWDDVSGNAVHATQGTGANQPLYETLQQVGLPGVDFVDSTDALTTSLTSSSRDETFYAVVSLDTLGSETDLLFPPNFGRIAYINSTGKLVVGKRATATIDTGTQSLTTGTPTLIGYTMSATTITMTQNGTADAPTNEATTFTGGLTTDIGGNIDGRIFEIIVAPEQTAANAEKIEGYLAHKWGLNHYLPETHAYKYAPPSTGGLEPKLLTARIDAGRNLVDDTSSQAIFPSAGDALTVNTGTTYRFRCVGQLTKGTNNVSMSFLFGGGATFTTCQYVSHGVFAASGTPAASSMNNAVAATATAIIPTSAAVNARFHLEGEFEINAGGTLIPQVAFSGATASTPTVNIGTFFEAWRIGTNPVTTIGPWG